MAPARIKATRSPMRIASSASWVTTIEVARVSCRMASVSSRIFSRRRGSRPENGSSITLGLGAMARASATRCWQLREMKGWDVAKILPNHGDPDIIKKGDTIRR
jgi:hypothetical protein